jgi:ABC-type lipoprotein export system ATPase subunit
MPETILSATNLRKSFTEADNGGPLVVLDGVDLEVTAGETIAITGPSGCGKSTLLNLLGTLDTPDTGTIRILNRDVTDLDDKALARLRAETIGFVFQLHHLLPQLTAIENVLLPTLATRDRSRRSASEARARQLLEAVGLQDRLHHRPSQLSGGERQRTAVARALINTPRLLLADEPTGALDEHNAGELVELLTRLARQEKMAIVAVTHDPDVAATMTRACRLERGLLV